MELYGERGYEQTTVAEIAERAGLTERTFFRHYADKRDVLFAGSALLQERMVDALASAPPSSAPIDAVAVALEAAATIIEARHDFARRRAAIITANAELLERELIKLDNLSAAMADGLRQRGVKEPAASLAAGAGIAVFRVAFERWIEGTGGRPYPRLMRESLDELKKLAIG